MITILERAINQYLHLDPASKDRLEKLEGKVVNVELLPLNWQFNLAFQSGAIKVDAGDANEAETTIRGTPMQLMGMMWEKDNRTQFFAEDVTIEGNASLGQQVTDIFDHLEIDWEHFLAKVMGDIPAFHTHQWLKRTNHFLGKMKDQFATYLSDYMHEEKDWLPTSEALQDFFADIDTLRMDTDRLAARVQLLLNKTRGNT